MHISLLKTSRAWVVGLVFMPLLACSDPTRLAKPEFREQQLEIQNSVITAEIADTDPLRSIGLMFREKLADNHGMWFVFDEADAHCMWMKNTLIDLDVAFISEDMTVINIESMKAKTLTPHCANGKARFALEMNRGWFRDRGIRAGQNIETRP